MTAVISTPLSPSSSSSSSFFSSHNPSLSQKLWRILNLTKLRKPPQTTKFVMDTGSPSSGSLHFLLPLLPLQLPQCRFDHQYGSGATTGLLPSETLDSHVRRRCQNSSSDALFCQLGSRNGAPDSAADSICFLLKSALRDSLTV
ncbi:hypothetical protein LINPERHAP2_LOCUS4166 [Linum perenne]